MMKELHQQDLGNKRGLEDKEEENIGDEPLGLEPWWLEDQGSLDG